jgi:hypothetical protein
MSRLGRTERLTNASNASALDVSHDQVSATASGFAIISHKIAITAPNTGAPANSPLSRVDLLHGPDLQIALSNEFLQRING